MCGAREGFIIMGNDAIHLRGLEFYAYHGVLQEEQVLGTRFIVDTDIFADLSRAGSSDQVGDTVHYGEVYQVIESCVTGERYLLIERLAEEIAGRILGRFNCNSVRVEVHKPQAPIAGIFRDISVEIWRRAGEKL